MSQEKDTKSQGLRLSQVLAGALAAVTAAVLGSKLGMAGTVAGAGIASVITTVGSALYLRSIERTGVGVRTVTAKVVSRNGSVVAVEQDAEPEQTGPAAKEPQEAGQVRPPGDKPRLPRALALVGGAALMFLLGMGVITGVEWAGGQQLSGGAGTTVGGIVSRDGDRGAPTTGTTPVEPTERPGGTSTAPTSVGEAPATSTGRPSGTGSPTSAETTPEATTTPPATTTMPAPSGGIVPTG